MYLFTVPNKVTLFEWRSRSIISLFPSSHEQLWSDFRLQSTVLAEELEVCSLSPTTQLTVAAPDCAITHTDPLTQMTVGDWMITVSANLGDKYFVFIVTFSQ